ncbi:MAG: WecB/TagA/CpsF family glycosyltransferase [Lachnospiraceae bacterium]|nr:WecB/TagA/CpsF family glycosyltransferase [Lachnospiraceae bacterium]
MNHRSPVLGVNYTTASISEVAGYLIRHAEDLAGQYICFSNVHTTVMAADDAEYREILNHSAMTFPDGMPVAKKIRQNGYAEAERVAGPDLMEALFKQSMGTGRKHYFYGSSEKTIEALKKNLQERYPYMEIVGMVSPPFRVLTEEEDAAAVQAINDSGADFVWIGLGAPKQEKWMYAHRGKINGVMLGVGAGFDFHAGTIRRAPSLIQRLGLEWLFRLLQNPGRLLKRYFITNTKFLIYTKLRKEKREDHDTKK